jgi:4-hydroxybenzoate polyprenyltransferase
MGIAIRFYRLLNILSIDIALGAMICSRFLALLLDVAPRPYAMASLGLTVWIIYTADHLLDARRVRGAASTERHRFHQRHFTMLSVVVAAAVVIDAVLILFIRRQVLYSGVLIMAIVGFYLLFHNRLIFLKEVFVALLYCLGVLLPSIMVTSIKFTSVHYVVFGLFFLVALINLLLFSLFDKADDEADNRRSFVTVVGEESTRTVLLGLFGLGFALGAYLAVALKQWTLASVLLLMLAGLFVIQVRRSWFAVDLRYRLLGDAVFLVPALYLFLKAVNDY